MVRSRECTLAVDLPGRAPGRGAYLCPEAPCLERALKSKSLERALGCPLPAQVVDQLHELSRPRAGQGGTR